MLNKNVIIGKNIQRGLKLISEIDRWYLVLLFIHALTTVTIPLIVLFYSTKIINIISYDLNKNSLEIAIIQILAIELVLSLVKEICNAKLQLHQNEWNIKIESLFLDINNKMKYVDLEKPETALLKNKINSNKNATGAGINNLISIFYSFISSFISIVIAILMSLDFFYATAIYKFNNINGVVITSVYILFMILCVAFCAYFNYQLYKRECLQWAKLPESNRVVNYFRKNIKANIGAMDIRIYDLEPKITNEFRKHSVESEHIVNINKIHTRIGIKKNIVLGFFWIITYILLACEVYYGNIKIGYFVEYTGAITCLLSTISEFISLIGRSIENNKYLEDYFAYIDLADNKIVEKIDTKIEQIEQIEVKNVSYKYPAEVQNVIDNINLKIQPGKKYAIVGENGSGKTTFIKILAGLYEPTEGKILINGVDTKSINKEKLFQIFSVVFQDFSLFSFSLGQNISGDKQYDENRACDVINQVGFYERFEELNNGLETNLFKDFDEDGILLSGGERQKVALARALYKDSPIFLLDEPTSAMDPIAEAEIYQKLNEIIKNKTSIFVSHRLSSCCFCDEIIVFDNGKIVQKGTHEELLKEENGKYITLWNAQAKYYKENERSVL